MYVTECHKTSIQKAKEKRKEMYIKTSLHPSKTYKHSPYKKMSNTNSPLKYKTTLSPKLLPFFVTNDKGQVTERSSTRHHWKS